MSVIDYTVIVMGDAKVGKTSFVKRFIDGTFTEIYTATVEDVYSQCISNNKQLCTMKVYDTAGAYQFPAMRSLAIKKADAIVLMYSVDIAESLNICEKLYSEIKEIKKEKVNQIPIILAGNKCDLETDIKIKPIDAEILAKRMRVGFIQISAKKNTKIDELFQKLLHMDVKRRLSISTNKYTNSRSVQCTIC